VLTSDFHYSLPDDAISQAAVEPRDSSRLLDTRDLSDHRFAELPALLERGDLLVVNTTRVRRARLAATKGTGGAVEVLLLNPIGDGGWEALVRPRQTLAIYMGVHGLDVLAEKLMLHGMAPGMPAAVATSRSSSTSSQPACPESIRSVRCIIQ